MKSRAAGWLTRYCLGVLICLVNVVGAAPLNIGTVKAVSSDQEIALSLSAGVSGGTGRGYAYDICRDTQPHFSPGNSNCVATLTNWSEAGFVDRHGLQPKVVYYYKIVGRDEAGNLTNAIPAGLDNPNNESALSVAASLKDPHLNIVYIGDSITEAAGLPDRAHQSPPAVCSQALRSLRGIRDVFMSNQGHSGATTVDFLPDTHIYFDGVEKAARNLAEAHPGMLVFSIMLGANDSANSTTRGAPVTADTYRKNLKTIIDRLLTDFPESRIVVHEPTWYSPNTHNSANYEETGLARLATYPEKINDLVHSYESTRSEQVLLGDQFAFRYFAANYLTTLSAQRGCNGTFYLHPNVEGSAQLARFWAEAMAFQLFPAR